MKIHQRAAGVTLVEMVVALSLLATGMTFAIPAFSGMLDRVRLKSGTDALMTGLRFARIEAIRRNGRVVLCKSESGHVCTRANGWEQGWIIFHDTNGNSMVDAGEDVLYRESSLYSSLKVVGNSPVNHYVAYNGLGRTSMSSGAFQAGTITVCQPSTKPGDAYQIVINSVGRARVAKTVVAQCS